jgi:hypothetical protein
MAASERFNTRGINLLADGRTGAACARLVGGFGPLLEKVKDAR